MFWIKLIDSNNKCTIQIKITNVFGEEKVISTIINVRLGFFFLSPVDSKKYEHEIYE